MTKSSGGEWVALWHPHCSGFIFLTNILVLEFNAAAAHTMAMKDNTQYVCMRIWSRRLRKLELNEDQLASQRVEEGDCSSAGLHMGY